MTIIARQRARAQDCAIASSVHLRSYTALNRYCLAEGLDGLYRLWLLARSLDTDGRGVVSLPDFLGAMHGFGLSRLWLRRASLHPKASLFFSIDSSKLTYRSLRAVCLALGVAPGFSIMIPTASIAGTERFRATLYAAWIAGHESLLISREKLAKLFQASADTLRRWEKLAGVEVTYNIVEVAPEDERAAEPHIPRDARLDDRMDRCYSWQYQGKTYYRTVNGYDAAHLERAPLGNVRKVTRAVHASYPDGDHGVGSSQRVFFTDRTTPQRYQEEPGASIRDTKRIVDLPQGRSTTWRFYRWRPTTRKQALC